MLREAALLTQLLLVAAEPPSADDDVPVSKLIPPDVPGASDQSAPPPSAPSPKALRGRATLEGVGTVASAARSLVVPYPTPAPPLWQGRLSLDLSGRWSASSRLSVTASDRVNVLTQDGTAVTAQSAFQNDLREAYVTWEALEGVFAEVGRENLRHGVALGFNPTDFFRAGSLVGQASLDPSVRRQNRLGTAMVRAQALWSGGAASVTYSPKLFKAPPLAATDRLGVDPRLDATNSVHRILCALNLEVADLSPELLAYLEPGQARFGLSLTRPLGESVIAYGEWAGGRQANLIARATAWGRVNGELPPDTPLLPASSNALAFRNDLAVGATWANAAARLTLSLEYHLHQGGLTDSDWRKWFDSAAMVQSVSQKALWNQLWYVRGFASNQLEPATAQAAFFRATWDRAFVEKLHLSGFAEVDLFDGSTLAQLSAIYDLTESWTLAAYGTAYVGAARTEWGSMPQALSGSLQFTWYLR